MSVGGACRENTFFALKAAVTSIKMTAARGKGRNTRANRDWKLALVGCVLCIPIALFHPLAFAISRTKAPEFALQD